MCSDQLHLSTLHFLQSLEKGAMGFESLLSSGWAGDGVGRKEEVETREEAKALRN